MQILATTDFFGSFAPQVTSYGHLPGGHALVHKAEALRATDPATVWIDTGDFAQGGPLAPLSSPTAVFEAVGSDLPIDVATLGNHELDWGRDGFDAGRAHLPFQIVCANAALDCPPTALMDTAEGPLGVVGLTHPQMRQMHPWFDETQPPPGPLTRELARHLRAQGARTVVVALHDGVDFAFADHGIVPDPSRMRQFCEAVAGTVDLVLGGHTLGRWIGLLSGVPFLQPWAYGAEIGVARIARDSDVTLSAVAPGPGRPWTGLGAEVVAQESARVVATLRADKTARPGKDTSLPELVARAVRRATGADLGLCFAPELQTNQPPIDGTIAFLPKGPVTNSQLLRLFPHQKGDSYGELARVRLTQDEVVQVLAAGADGVEMSDNAVNPKVWGPPSAFGQTKSGETTVAMGLQWVPRVATMIGRALEPEPCHLLIREAVTLLAEDGRFEDA